MPKAPARSSPAQIGEDTVTFIWTAAHVVDGLRTTRTVVTPQGTPRILVEYRDAEIVQERQQDGRRVGEVKYDCKVIKVSDADYGEDLALLDGPLQGAYPLNVCAKFHKDPNYIPPIGVELSHCGSLLGQFGANSYTTGVLSQTGRTLADEGCQRQGLRSGDGRCLPRLVRRRHVPEGQRRVHRDVTQGVMKLQGFNFIVPVRRIHAWSKAAKIEWAIDPAVPMPSLKEIDAIPVEDAGQSPGGYPQRNPAGGTDEGGAPAFKPPFNFDDAIHWVEKLLVRSARASVLLRSSPVDPASCDRQHLSRVAAGQRHPASLNHQPARRYGEIMRLTKKKVEKIKQAIADGTKQTEIAKRFKASRSVVSDIATGRVHKDVEWPGGEPPTPKRAGGQHKNIPDYDPTDKRVMELEAEIVHLTDGAEPRAAEGQGRGEDRRPVQGRSPRKWTSGSSRSVRLPPAFEFRRKAQIVEHCVMHLSDGHHDQVVRPEEVGGLEDYNFPISCARAERYVNTVVEWTPGHVGPEVLLSRCSGCWPTATTPAGKSTRRASGPTTATSSGIAWPSASCTP